MKKSILNGYTMNLNYLNALTNDVAEEEKALQPSGIRNHAAWTLGHLVLAADGAAKMLGLDPMIPDNYGELFGQGTTPTNDAARYPALETLLSQLTQQHERIAAAFTSVSDDVLAKPLENEDMRAYFPTTGDLVVFLMSGHEGVHIGQFSAWRRALGKGPALPGI